MASANISWMPATGRHRVEVGSSLARALKSRKLNGEAPPPANKRLPDKDFYSFRYNHKPPSVDVKKQGMIEFTKRDGSTPTSVVLEQPSVQPGESAMFRGQETALNKHECVLIYDEDTGTFTLEKLDGCLQLTQDRSLAPIIPRNASPTPSVSTPRETNNGYNRSSRDDAIDQSILDLVDDDLPPPRTTTSAGASSKQSKRKAPPAPVKEEEEEDEEDDFPIASRQISPQKPAAAQKHPVAAPAPPASTRPVKPIPKPRTKQAPAAPPSSVPAPPAATSKPLALPGDLPPRPVASSSGPAGRNQRQQQPLPPQPQPQRPQSKPVSQADPDVEELEIPVNRIPPAVKSSIARPGVARPGSKPKQALAPKPPPPPPPAPAPLALPGSSSAQTVLPSSLPRPGGGKGRSAVVEPAPPVAELSDSDEDDWEQVPTSNAGAAPEVMNTLTMEEESIFGGEDGAMDEELLEQELELEMELADGLEAVDEDEDDDDDMEPAPIPEDAGPISLNDFAGGGSMNVMSDDDYSSSDDSDDD